MSLYSRIIDIQKLNDAWKHVKKNKPASGVDGVTYEQFNNNIKEEIKSLNVELANHNYETLPVKHVTIYKGEKARIIALYSMRDKVVQQSIAVELNKIYDSRFSSQTYAYRNNRSALVAINEIADKAKMSDMNCFLKIDIEHYFDTIQWKKLEGILRGDIQEDDAIELIRINACARVFDSTSGDIHELRVGIHQGSNIAPILSNIYLMEFDNWLLDCADYFVRYSDDLLILGNSKESLAELGKQVVLKLEALGLSINKNKSVIGTLDTGVDFLGYHFDKNGKSVPSVAEDNLVDRLEMLWLTGGASTFDERAKKALEIIGGWAQYFREEREISSILEYAAVMYAADGDNAMIEQLRDVRFRLSNDYRDIAIYLSELWAEHNWWQLELLEYEQYYSVPVSYTAVTDDNAGRTIEILLENYVKYTVVELPETATEIMQCYTDLKKYEQAEVWMKKKDELDKRAYINSAILPTKGKSGKTTIVTKATPSKFKTAFVGREDVFGKEGSSNSRGRNSELQMLPLTEKEITKHLSGNITVDTYVQRPNATVRFIVFDVDISKKMLLQHGVEGEKFDALLNKAFIRAHDIKKLIESFGLKCYIEFSGYRGYHVWLFLTEWVPVRYANMFTEIVEARLKDTESDDISVEYFPNKTRIKAGKFGQCIKLPYGIHEKTGVSSYFLDEESNPIENVDMFVDSIAKFSLSAIKKVLASNSGIKEMEEKKEIDIDISEFGNLPASIVEVLSKCTLMKYLCNKSFKTAYLTHFERLSILYVFGHLGDEGKEFVHQVMSYTLNYKYNVTDKFINRLPAKPVSCVKLRDQYKQVTAEYGCNCVFKRTKNCYPSPVLHAIALSNDLQEDITVPTSRTLTKEKASKVKNEINIHYKAQEIAVKILDMKKQKRGLDKSIKKLEGQLEVIYNEAKVDCLEIEMGMLVRRKKDDGYEWIIEI